MSNENQTTTSDDFPIWKKRSRKPNSLLKPEEDYDPLWMLQPAKKGKRKSILSEDLIDVILNKASEVNDASNCFGEEVVGRRSKVLWPLDQIFYKGKITSFNNLDKTHQVDYDDGDHEKLDLSKECWLLIGDDGLSTQKIILMQLQVPQQRCKLLGFIISRTQSCTVYYHNGLNHMFSSSV
ncbi:hypothetical protein ACP275_12G044800 [Erythranthe tilingii]